MSLLALPAETLLNIVVLGNFDMPTIFALRLTCKNIEDIIRCVSRLPSIFKYSTDLFSIFPRLNSVNFFYDAKVLTPFTFQTGMREMRLHISSFESKVDELCSMVNTIIKIHDFNTFIVYNGLNSHWYLKLSVYGSISIVETTMNLQYTEKILKDIKVDFYRFVYSVTDEKDAIPQSTVVSDAMYIDADCSFFVHKRDGMITIDPRMNREISKNVKRKIYINEGVSIGPEKISSRIKDNKLELRNRKGKKIQYTFIRRRNEPEKNTLI